MKHFFSHTLSLLYATARGRLYPPREAAAFALRSAFTQAEKAANHGGSRVTEHQRERLLSLRARAERAERGAHRQTGDILVTGAGHLSSEHRTLILRTRDPAEARRVAAQYAGYGWRDVTVSPGWVTEPTQKVVAA